LRPHLKRAAKDDTTADTDLEKVHPGLGTFRSLKVDLLFDFLEFKNHEVVLLVTSTVEVSKDLQSLCLAVRRMRLIK